jgi:cytidine deaminase
MYSGWKKGGAHTKEWMNKSQKFIDCAFSLANNDGVKCPCSRCRNSICEDKRML